MAAPQPQVNIPLDERWNRQLMTSELTQSILQGESISKMADRMRNVTDMNLDSAIRNARTAVTGAENGARDQAAYEVKDELARHGFTLKKEWIATFDARTRDSHAEADGQVVDIDDSFRVGGASLRYPGDPSGPAREVYNCRCRRQDKVGGFDEAEPRTRHDQLNGQRISDMSYKEWAAAKKIEELDVAKSVSEQYNRTVSSYVSVDREAVVAAARSGEKHRGVYADALKKRQTTLEKSIASHTAQVEEHARKIQNPSDYDAGWSDKDSRAQAGLLRKWDKDMRRNAEQAEIEISVWKERFENEQ